MPISNVPDTVQAELIYNWDGQVCETVLHFLNVGIIDTTTAKALGNALVAWWNANIKASAPTTLSLTGVKLTNLASPTGFVVFADTGLPVVGTSASPSLPNNVALVLTKRTILRGRSYRGRVYHPGLGESSVTGNVVNAGQVTAWITAYNLLRVQTVGAETWTLGVVSRYENGLQRVPDAVFTPVDSFTSDGLIDSQRRRLPGRGA